MKKILTLILGCSACFAYSQTDSASVTPPDSIKKSVTLTEVQITDSAEKKELIYIPAAVAKLQTTELKRTTGLFLDDAINANIPGVFMQRRTVSAGQTFNIRGYGNGARGTNGVSSNFDTQGAKVYLNGIPITDAEGITLMDDIDFASVGNVEVIKGPSGSLYGLAIAGVVNLQTVKPPKGQVSVGQDVLMGSYGLGRFTTNVTIGTERSSVLINYGKQVYDGFMPHTASHKDFANAFGEFKVSNKQSVNVYLGFSNSYDERNGELTIGQYDTLNYAGNTAYIKNNAHSNIISFRAGLGHTYKFNSHFSNTTTVFGTGISSNVSSAGGWTDKTPLNYGVRSTLDMKFKLSEKFALSSTTGLEAQRQDAQTLGYPMVADSTNVGGYNIIGAIRSNQVTTTSTSTFFSEWTLAMPYDISLTAGVGVSNMNIKLDDHFYVAANNKPVRTVPLVYTNSYNNLVSPRASLIKVFKKQVSVYVSYSRGYKAPVSSYFFIPTTGQVNTGLNSETGDQFEIGTKGNLLNNKLNYEIALFNAIFSNKMTTVAVPNSSKTATLYTYVVNGGSLNNKGVEALVKYTAYQSETGFVKFIRPFVNTAYSDFKYVDYKFQSIGKTVTTPKVDSALTVDYSGKAVAGVPPLTLGAGIDFATRPGLYANVNYYYRDAMPFTSDGLNTTEAYSLLNAKIGFQRTFAKHIYVDAYFGLNNIMGAQYYQMVFINQLPDAYIPGPNEMNYYGGITLKYIF